MLGSENHVGGPEEGVRTGGENGDVITSDVENNFRTSRFTDPVFLEQFDRLWPVEVVELID